MASTWSCPTAISTTFPMSAGICFNRSVRVPHSYTTPSLSIPMPNVGPASISFALCFSSFGTLRKENPGAIFFCVGSWKFRSCFIQIGRIKHIRKITMKIMADPMATLFSQRCWIIVRKGLCICSSSRMDFGFVSFLPFLNMFFLHYSNLILGSTRQ